MGKTPDPKHSKYDPKPLDPNDKGNGDGPTNPDHGKNLENHAPNVTVNWNTPPTFDDNPPAGDHNPDGDSVGTQTVADSGPIKFDAGAVRAAETSLLSHEKAAVADYTALREHTLAAVHNPTFFAPAHVDPGSRPGTGGKAGEEAPLNPPENELHEMGEKFAADMVPLMERALEQMGNSLQVLGQYITMINRAGQTYAQTDRASRFPAPPA
ncbi:hypothetical protein ACWD7F_25735 [Streptomyces sp. NPDC005122]